ncbi:MAG: FAD-dependent oxidoreductase [Trueperaceae bacterium]|nr:FAD-dependent oxidoreductase [Trueperaceae bacterium]
MSRLKADIAIIGGSLGGVAACLAALRTGHRVILTESSDWLGGQVSSQGVSALDEHKYIESFGANRSYYEFREAIRNHYETRYGVRVLNPGGGWVSRLCFEPRVAEQIIREWLEPYLRTGQLHILYKTRPHRAEVNKHKLLSVSVKTAQGLQTLKAKYFLDATDLGELLPLSQTAYVSGAEGQAQTGETYAGKANSDEVQSFTYSFVVEYCPGENHTLSKPANYEYNRDHQPYTLAHDGGRQYRMFQQGEKGELPFWTYRRIFAAEQFNDPRRPNDLALINWPGNDFRFANLIDKPLYQQRKILRQAKDLALGFLYWLQTECPRDEGGYGYPELKLRKDIMGTRDGLAKQPYIRESRRILALETIRADDILEKDRLLRARHFGNSVGIGWYNLDLHRASKSTEESTFAATLPFQIPLGSLIPQTTLNLLPACKNLGSTHLSNGAYRVHPVEWAIGEAAGHLASFCLRTRQQPKTVWKNKAATRALQINLLNQGIPLSWLSNVPETAAQFQEAQVFALDYPDRLATDSFEIDLGALPQALTKP